MVYMPQKWPKEATQVDRKGREVSILARGGNGRFVTFRADIFAFSQSLPSCKSAQRSIVKGFLAHDLVYLAHS